MIFVYPLQGQIGERVLDVSRKLQVDSDLIVARRAGIDEGAVASADVPDRAFIDGDGTAGVDDPFGEVEEVAVIEEVNSKWLADVAQPVAKRG